MKSLPVLDDTDRSGIVSLDIVIPVYNEEEILDHLFNRLETVFSKSAMDSNGLSSVRFVFVDDGSEDSSANKIYKKINSGANAVLLRLSRNFGHQCAVSAGIAETSADLTAVIDSDLQDPPELILEMLAKWRDGFDVVYGLRRNRHENIIKKAGYWMFYRLLDMLTDLKVPLDSGDFCLMDSRIVTIINDLPEILRFPRGLRTWVGFRQTGIEYDRPEREFGRTKYTYRKLYRLATDGITSLSTRPLKFTQLFSLITVIFSIVVLGVIVVTWVLNKQSGVDMWMILLILLVLMTSAVQLMGLHLLGAYVGRTYLEVKNRPAYIIMQKIEQEKD